MIPVISGLVSHLVNLEGNDNWGRGRLVWRGITLLIGHQHLGISPQSCTETDFEMKTSNFVLFLLISVVSVHFRAIDDETIPCQA